MSTTVYQCPCCSAALAYSGESGKLECASCGNAFDPELLDSMNGAGESSVHFEQSASSYSQDDAEMMSAYSCKNCGAELVTDATATSAECPYCGSPTILSSRIESGVKPEVVVPFKITKEQATEIFNSYFKGKRLLPNIFLNTRNRISEMKRLYVPYWLFNCDADADFTYTAERVHRSRSGDYEVTTTEHYLLRRAGHIGFDAIPVDGSVKMDDKISESLEPYDLASAVAFQPAVLAGALADRADVGVEACERRAIERVEQSVENEFRATTGGYSGVCVRNRSIRSEGGKATPALMPVWMISTEKLESGKRTTYTFAINGQTGELTTDVKPDPKKSFLWTTGIFAGTFAIGYALLVALNAMGVIG